MTDKKTQQPLVVASDLIAELDTGDDIMKDQTFLIWLHEHLEMVHGENSCFDYMHKLRALIKATPKEQYTPNTLTFNNLDELMKDLEKGE